MNRRGFLKRIMIGACAASVPIALAKPSKEWLKNYNAGQGYIYREGNKASEYSWLGVGRVKNYVIDDDGVPRLVSQSFVHPSLESA